VIPILEFMSLRTICQPTTITAFASKLSTAGITSAVIASLHVDLAEESSDSDLTAVLTRLVSSTRLSVQPRTPASAILEQFHAQARHSGRYYSAAAVVTNGARFNACCAGLASLTFRDRNGVKTAIPAQVTSTGPCQHLLKNAVGTAHFVLPDESVWPLGPDETLLSVGGLLQDDPQWYSLHNPTPAQRATTARGGVLVRIRPTRNFA
jgi:hypothetical protein